VPWADVVKQPFLSGLNFNFNKFTGSIPQELFGSTMLTSLQLAANNFSGTLSSAVARLTALTALLINSNMLSGTVPSAISALSALEVLYLSANNFSGTLPALAPLTALTNLRVFQNQFVGADFSNFKVPTTCILESGNDTNCLPNCPAPCCAGSANVSCNAATPATTVATTTTTTTRALNGSSSGGAPAPVESAGGLSTGAIVGIACGVTAIGLVALGVGLWYAGVFKRKSEAVDHDPDFPQLFVPLSMRDASPVYSNIPESPPPSTKGYAELPLTNDAPMPSAP
jgi:hypothetical protein